MTVDRQKLLGFFFFNPHQVVTVALGDSVPGNADFVDMWVASLVTVTRVPLDRSHSALYSCGRTINTKQPECKLRSPKQTALSKQNIRPGETLNRLKVLFLCRGGSDL